jgi:MYXO-CTERM domain-containing protein
MRNTSRSAAAAAALGACALLSAAPAAALTPTTGTEVAQTQVSGFSRYIYQLDDDQTTAFLGIDECVDAIEQDAEFTVQFTTTTPFTSPIVDDLFEAAYTFRVDRDATTAVSCAGNEVCTTLDPDADLTITDTAIQVSLSARELFQISDPVDCATVTSDDEYFVRLTWDPDRSTEGAFSTADMRFILDTTRPDAPSLTSALATENTVSVAWEDASAADLDEYALVYATDAFSGGVLPSEVTAAIASARNQRVADNESNSQDVTADLTPEATVYIALSSRDQAGNYSELSAVVESTVVDTVDFWEAYRNAGGQEEGGYCAHTPAGAPERAPVALMILGGFVLVGMRRRR